jgi:excisionase family DNA binding protein
MQNQFTLTTEEAAKFLKCDRSTISRLINQSRTLIYGVHYSKVGQRRMLFNPEALTEWLETHPAKRRRAKNGLAAS